MIYLASPYSHKDPHVIQHRVEQTMQAFANLINRGFHVFSPILMCHKTSLTYNLPGDAAYWEAMNTNFIRRMDSMYVLCIPGWATSKGVQQEIKLAKQLGMPLLYIDILGTSLDPMDLPA